MESKDRIPSRKERRAAKRALESRNSKKTSSEHSWFEKTKRKIFRPKTLIGLTALTMAITGGAAHLYDRIGLEMDVASARAELARADVSVGKKILDLDSRIAKNPRLFDPILPDMVRFSVENYCSTSGCDPNVEIGVISLQNEEEYVKTYNAEDGCGPGLTKPIPAAELASNDTVSNRIYFNTERVKRRHIQYAASTIYQMTIHEEGHREPEPKPVSESELKLYSNMGPGIVENPRVKGFLLIGDDVRNNRRDSKCVVSIRGDLEEAVIHLTVEDRMRSHGLRIIESQPYSTYAKRLKERVVDPYLGGDLKVLKKHHKDSNTEGLFTFIGQTRQLSGDDALWYGNAVVHQALMNR